MKYRVAIISHIPQNAYSGGRYHAWILGEALAAAGDDVTFYTNNIPVFAEDFSNYPNHQRIQTVCLTSFQELVEIQSSFDYVVCIPSFSDLDFFYLCMLFCLKNSAKFVFINFETPNWFEQYGRTNLGPDGYRVMQKLSSYGSLVLSSAHISMHYAKEFFNSSQTLHDVWSPAINSMVADRVHSGKENKIFIGCRPTESHKGADVLPLLMDESLRDMTMVCMFGRTYTDEQYLSAITKKAEKYGIRIKPLYRISDEEKFTEIKKSKLLLFPSSFEGYGYPPVEALYCGTYVLAYDLPVIREVCGNAVDYCVQNDINGMKQKILEILKRPAPKQIIVETADFMLQSKRIHELLEKYEDSSILNFTESKRNKIIKEINKTRIELQNKEIYQIPSILRAKSINRKLSHLLNVSDEHLAKISLKGKKVYLYGCGLLYLQLYPKYRKLLNIHGIIDSDLTRVGKIDEVSQQFVIQSPDVLKNEDSTNTVVFITPINYIDDIIRSIKTMGEFEVHSLCMIEMNDMETNC